MFTLCFIVFMCGILENKKEKFQENINIYIFLFLLLLFSFTFIIGRPRLSFYSWTLYGQYIPFQTIISQIKYGSLRSIFINIIGNSLMLIPLSFLLMIKHSKYKIILRQLIITFPLVIGIELLQAYTHTGSFDVDDIILNLFGSIIFTFIMVKTKIIDKICIKYYKNYNIKDNFKYTFLYISILINIIYIIYAFCV